MCRIEHLAKKNWGWQFGDFLHLLCQFVEKREVIKLAIWQKIDITGKVLKNEKKEWQF